MEGEVLRRQRNWQTLTWFFLELTGRSLASGLHKFPGLIRAYSECTEFLVRIIRGFLLCVLTRKVKEGTSGANIGVVDPGMMNRRRVTE